MAEETNVRGEIKKLITLQEIDTKIYDLKTVLEELPQEKEKMEASLQEKTAGISEAEEELKKIQVEKSQKETEMQSCEEKIKKHEAELNLIKTNKEYTALLQEIGSQKADISLFEEEIINYLDKIEEVQALLAEEKSKFEEEKKIADSEKARMDSEIKNAQTSLGEYENTRTKLAAEVGSNILQKYERILANRGRIAVTKLDGEFCGECNMTLRPQILDEARLQKDLVVCESCGRILYVEEEN